jgi:hypothetical protein
LYLVLHFLVIIIGNKQLGCTLPVGIKFSVLVMGGM